MHRSWTRGVCRSGLVRAGRWGGPDPPIRAQSLVDLEPTSITIRRRGGAFAPRTGDLSPATAQGTDLTDLTPASEEKYRYFLSNGKLPPADPGNPGQLAQAGAAPPVRSARDLENAIDKYLKYSGCFFLIVVACGITLALLSNFGLFKSHQHHHDHDDPQPEPEDGLAVSGDLFRKVYEALASADQGDGWTGTSATHYGDHTAAFHDLIRQVAETNQDANTTVETEAQQVNTGRATLKNTLNGLQLAMPISESLYFSGPAGPALSYNFQLTVASSAVNTGTDTTNNMHQNAQRNAECLTALLGQYDEALRLVPPSPYHKLQRTLTEAPQGRIL